MKVVIAGYGKVGDAICAELSDEVEDLLLIDINGQLCEKAVVKYDLGAVAGDCMQRSVLQKAELENTDIYIAVTSSDTKNLISASLAKKMGADYTIARVRSTELTPQMLFMQEALNIDHIICPETYAAREICDLLLFPKALDVASFAGGRVVFLKFPVRADSPIEGLNMIELRKKWPELIVSAILRADGTAVIPKGLTELHKDDLIEVTGSKNDLIDFYYDIGQNRLEGEEESSLLKALGRREENILIVGAGGITHNIIKILNERYTGRAGRELLSDKDVKLSKKIAIIENKNSVADDLCAEFDDITVYRGDGSDYAFLDEINIGAYDVVMALTGFDEENLMICIYAARRGVAKTITKINRTRLLSVLGDSPLQHIITPKEICADIMVSFVRAKSNAEGSEVTSLFRILDNKVELLEFKVKAKSKLAGKQLKDLRIKDHSIVSYIIRGQRVIFPSGSEYIEAGDDVVIATTGKQINDLDNILEEEGA